MQIKLKVHENRRESFLNKMIFVLLGIFTTCAIFAFLLEQFSTLGIGIGYILLSTLIFLSLRYGKKSPFLRLATYGSLGALITITLLFIVGITLISSKLQGF